MVHDSWIDSSDSTVGMEAAYARDFTDEIDLIDGIDLTDPAVVMVYLER